MTRKSGLFSMERPFPRATRWPEQEQRVLNSERMAASTVTKKRLCTGENGHGILRRKAGSGVSSTMCRMNRSRLKLQELPEALFSFIKPTADYVIWLRLR